MRRGGRGDIGERGRDGATGAEGRAGTTGITGAAGAVGGSGAMGPAGPRGKPARNAAAAFLILMTFSFMGFLRVDQQTQKIEDLARESVIASREGCERLNIVRENQAQVLTDQIKQSELALKSSLGALESFRKQIREGIVLRKQARQKLVDSVREHPMPGKPYSIDCRDAYP